MYESFYGFSEKPFNLTPDPKYLYLSARHTEAFAHLEFGQRERGGFVVVTGEVGMGKTTLARYFLGRLEPGTATAVVLYPALSAVELLRSLVEDLHLPSPGGTLKELVDQLHRFLLEARAAGRNVVLLIDEAQDLSPEVLEQVRLLSNLETDTEKLIQIVLMGQSELQEMLARRELRQLAQRVTARYHLSPLGATETEDYIRHRLRIAGGEGKVTFTAAALKAVHRASGGVPRLINLVCDRALLAGYVQGTRTIEAAMVRRAWTEVRGQDRRRPRPASIAVATAVALALIGAGFASVVRPGRAADPTPLAAASPAPPAAPVPSPSSASLDPLVLGLSREASLAASIARVEALWGNEPLQRTSFRTHLQQLQRLDVPVVLEMSHPARRDVCYLALLHLDGAQAEVATGEGVLRVPIAEVDRLWTRQAIFLWKDFESMTRAEPLQAAAWARQSLERLGYGPGDSGLAAEISRFQRDSDLQPDGRVGARTLLALYSAGPYPRPRLKDPREGRS